MPGVAERAGPESLSWALEEWWAATSCRGRLSRRPDRWLNRVGEDFYAGGGGAGGAGVSVVGAEGVVGGDVVPGVD